MLDAFRSVDEEVDRWWTCWVLLRLDEDVEDSVDVFILLVVALVCEFVCNCGRLLVEIFAMSRSGIFGGFFGSCGDVPRFFGELRQDGVGDGE